MLKEDSEDKIIETPQQVEQQKPRKQQWWKIVDKY